MFKKFFKNSNLKSWLYLLPAIIFLGIFMVYPLIDVFVYRIEKFSEASFIDTMLMSRPITSTPPIAQQREPFSDSRKPSGRIPT